MTLKFKFINPVKTCQNIETSQEKDQKKEFLFGKQIKKHVKKQEFSTFSNFFALIILQKISQKTRIFFWNFQLFKKVLSNNFKDSQN